MGRNYLKGRGGDRINAVLAAAGYNFGLLLRWLARLLRALMRMLLATQRSSKTPKERSSPVLHGRLYKKTKSPLQCSDRCSVCQVDRAHLFDT
jgi:hypothetical protein